MKAESNYEELVLATVRGILGKSDATLGDDFFTIGGESLKALQLISQLKKETGVKLTLQQLFDCPTIGALAGLLASGDGRSPASEENLDLEPSDGTILLRRWSAESSKDLAALRSAATDPYIVQIEYMPSPFTERAALDWIARKDARWTTDQGFDFAIVHIESGDTIGGISVNRRHIPGLAEIGSWIIPEWRGKKMVSRANRLMSEWTLTGPTGVERLEAMVEPEVIAPQKVWEGLGFTKEGLLRSYIAVGERRGDVIIYSMLRSEVVPGRGFGQPLN